MDWSHCIFAVVTVIFLCVLNGIEAHESIGLTIEVEDNTKMCFFEFYRISKKYIFKYEVIRGGHLDIDVFVENVHGATIYDENRRNKDEFLFDTAWGTFTFCFNNKFSSVTHKVVYFEIRPSDHRPLAVEAGIKRPSANTQVQESMENLHRYNTDISRVQKDYRLKEMKGRFLAETLNSRIFWWSAGQSLLIVSIAMSQVYFLKRFFTDTRTTSAPPPEKEVVYANPVSDPIEMT